MLVQIARFKAVRFVSCDLTFSSMFRDTFTHELANGDDRLCYLRTGNKAQQKCPNTRKKTVSTSTLSRGRLIGSWCRDNEARGDRKSVV